MNIWQPHVPTNVYKNWFPLPGEFIASAGHYAAPTTILAVQRRHSFHFKYFIWRLFRPIHPFNTGAPPSMPAEQAPLNRTSRHNDLPYSRIFTLFSNHIGTLSIPNFTAVDPTYMDTSQTWILSWIMCMNPDLVTGGREDFDPQNSTYLFLQTLAGDFAIFLADCTLVRYTTWRKLGYP